MTDYRKKTLAGIVLGDGREIFMNFNRGRNEKILLVGKSGYYQLYKVSLDFNGELPSEEEWEFLDAGRSVNLLPKYKKLCGIKNEAEKKKESRKIYREDLINALQVPINRRCAQMQKEMAELKRSGTELSDYMLGLESRFNSREDVKELFSNIAQIHSDAEREYFVDKFTDYVEEVRSKGFADIKINRD